MAPTLSHDDEQAMSDAPDDTKLTRTKSRWAELGKFLTGMTARPEETLHLGQPAGGPLYRYTRHLG